LEDPKNVWMPAKDLFPIRLVVKPDHDVTHFQKPLRDRLVLANLVRFIVRWPISAAFRAVAAATVVFPTPPLPVKKRIRVA
jgi:hypothetical protein